MYQNYVHKTFEQQLGSPSRDISLHDANHSRYERQSHENTNSVNVARTKYQATFSEKKSSRLSQTNGFVSSAHLEARNLTSEFQQIFFEERKNHVQQLEQLQNELAHLSLEETNAKEAVANLNLEQIDLQNEKDVLICEVKNAKTRYHTLKSGLAFQREILLREIKFLENRLEAENELYRKAQSGIEQRRIADANQLNVLYGDSTEKLIHDISDLNYKITDREEELKYQERQTANFHSDVSSVTLAVQKIKHLEFLRFQNYKASLSKLLSEKQKLLNQLSERINRSVGYYDDKEAVYAEANNKITAEIASIQEQIKALDKEITVLERHIQISSQENMSLELELQNLKGSNYELQKNLDSKEIENILDIEDTGIRNLETIEQKEQELRDLDDRVLLMEEKIWEFRNQREEQQRRKKEINDELRHLISDQFASILKQ